VPLLLVVLCFILLDLAVNQRDAIKFVTMFTRYGLMHLTSKLARANSAARFGKL
jgi:hypothetical protein